MVALRVTYSCRSRDHRLYRDQSLTDPSHELPFQDLSTNHKCATRAERHVETSSFYRGSLLLAHLACCDSANRPMSYTSFGVRQVSLNLFLSSQKQCAQGILLDWLKF